MTIFDKFGDALKGVGNKIADIAVDSGNAIADIVVDSGNAIAGVAKYAVDAAADAGSFVVTISNYTATEAITLGKDRIASGIVSASNSFVGGVESANAEAWRSLSAETNQIARNAVSAGISISDGLILGVEYTKEGFSVGAEKIQEGAVLLEEFIEVNACNIFVGSALSACFVVLAADGESEAAMTSISTAIAAEFINKSELNFAAKLLASIIAEGVYNIPILSDNPIKKDEFITIISFLIVKVCTEKKELVIGTLGQVIVGALIYGATKLICERRVPSGYKEWLDEYKSNTTITTAKTPPVSISGYREIISKALTRTNENLAITASVYDDRVFVAKLLPICDNKDSQIWEIRLSQKNKDCFFIINKKTKKCISRTNGNNGTHLIQIPIQGADENSLALWRIEHIGHDFVALNSLSDWEQKINIPGDGPYTENTGLITYGWCNGSINELWIIKNQFKKI